MYVNILGIILISKDVKMLSLSKKAVWEFTKNYIFFLLFDQYDINLFLGRVQSS